MATFNAIVPGEPWAQTFRFPDGAVDYAGGETIRASFRRNAASPLLLSIVEPDGIVRNGNDYSVQLSAAQTLGLVGLDRVSFDLYADKAGASRPLQVRVHVPVTAGL